MITQEQILHIAKLAAIEVAPAELEKMSNDLSSILDYVEKLQAVSSAGVAATSHVHGVTNVFREDIAKESLSKESLESFAPDFVHGGFRVPRII
jgi:aspartyl-tRNA(Asn)/glutamyl-tRNA(Gln) amidotransferase subunit C